MRRVLSDSDSYTEVTFHLCGCLFGSPTVLILCIICFFFFWLLCHDCLSQVKLNWLLQGLEEELFSQRRTSCRRRCSELCLLCLCVLQHNSSDVESRHKRITVRGLQPYTEYTARVRCGAAKHFWRWSEWSQPLPIRTKEGSMSNLWRSKVWGVFLAWHLSFCLLLLFCCVAKAEACCMHKRNTPSKLQEDDFLNSSQPPC